MKPNILIADDSPTIVSILTFLLSEEGYNVYTAADGVEAVEMFYKNIPDLVVLDVEMPRLNGYQVCRMLKNDPGVKDVPIIILTSRDLQGDRFRGLAMGADSYIIKDLEDDNLLVTIRELLKNSPWSSKSKPNPIVIKDNEILQRVNAQLDQKLFLSSLLHSIEELSSWASDFEMLKMKLLEIFSSVFEFSAGGFLIDNGNEIEILIGINHNQESELGDLLKEKMLSQYANALNREIQYKQVVLQSSIGSILPKANKFNETMFWNLEARGTSIGLIGFGSSMPIKYDQNSGELVNTFRHQSSIVLDNALLVNRIVDTNKKLEKTLAELKSTQTQLIESEKLASLGQLTAGLAHELNNPLNFISGNITHIKNYSDTLISSIKVLSTPDNVSNIDIEEIEYIEQDFPNLIKDCEEGIQRSQIIVNDLRTFGSRDRGDMVLSNLSEVIDSILNILKHQWEGKVTVIRNYDAKVELTCNPNQIGQVALNLISNAILALIDKDSEYKEVRISLSKDDRNTYLIVKDNGVGISEKNIKSLFEPFFSTRAIGKGMGLGLSIVHGIIQRHNGEISVQSTLGEGAEFTVRLPIFQQTDN